MPVPKLITFHGFKVDKITVVRNNLTTVGYALSTVATCFGYLLAIYNKDISWSWKLFFREFCYILTKFKSSEMSSVFKFTAKVD
jgi:hypothetical protein